MRLKPLIAVIAFLISVPCVSLRAQPNLPPVTGVQSQQSNLVAAEHCCPSGVAQTILLIPGSADYQIEFGRGLARAWNKRRGPQTSKIKAAAGPALPGLVYPFLTTVSPTTPYPPRPRICDEVFSWISRNRPCSSTLSISVDPQSKFLTVFFRVYDNKIRWYSSRGGFVPCGTFDLEVTMVFHVTNAVALRSSDIRPGNVVSTGACSGTFKVEEFKAQIFEDAGTAQRLADLLNSYLRRAAKGNGIRAMRPGVRSESPQTLVFEITAEPIPSPG